jgi:predicted house-cleaning noncanonical NTP pyrophosphatase (MazG superfamily)
MQYNKLVRDKIPEILKQKNIPHKTHIADNTEYWFKLKDKLKEEVEEFLKDSNKEELADILEVIDSICKFKNIDKPKLELLKKEKTLKRGSFNNKIILEES